MPVSNPPFSHLQTTSDSLRGSGCRNLALPDVYEQALPFFQLLPDFLLLNLAHTTRGCYRARGLMFSGRYT